MPCYNKLIIATRWQGVFMKFDKSKVQTVVSAKVLFGNKGFFANTLDDLQKLVEGNKKPLTLTKFDDSGFYTENGKVFQYFYPVEETAEAEMITESVVNHQSKRIKATPEDLLKKLEQRYGTKEKVLSHCAETTNKFQSRLNEMAEEIQKFLEENNEVSMLGGFSVVFGVRILGNQKFAMLTGAANELIDNALKINECLKSSISES